jgi:hypothetical protein
MGKMRVNFSKFYLCPNLRALLWRLEIKKNCDASTSKKIMGGIISTEYIHVHTYTHTHTHLSTVRSVLERLEGGASLDLV